MRINFDRLSQLAGLPSSGNNTRRGLYEGRGHKDEGRGDGGPPVPEMMDPAMEAMDELPPDAKEMRDNEPTIEELMGMHNEDDHGDGEPKDEMSGHLDEIIEVDEAMLVQELRRAKRIMNENKRRSLNESRRRNMFEAQLKQIIDEEVSNVMDEMNLTSGWVYGDRRPRNSRKGYTNQGSMMPGIGFRRR